MSTRLAAAVVGVTIAAAMTVTDTAAGEPGGVVVAEQFALADWTVFTSRTEGVWYVAMVFRGALLPFGYGNEAVVAKGTCTRTFVKHGSVVACEARGKGHELGLDEFQMDPMLASADLSFHQGKYRQIVHWKGRGSSPGPQIQSGADAGGAQADVGMARAAVASAHIFGISLKPQRFQFAFLVQEAGAFASGDANVTFGRDGSVRVKRTYRIR